MLADKGRRLKRTERKGQAITDDWQRDTDGHWRTQLTLFDDKSEGWLGKDNDCVKYIPAAAANPYSYRQVLPSSSYHLHWCSWVISSFQKGLVQYKYKMLNPKYGLSLHKNKPHKEALGSTHTKIMSTNPTTFKPERQTNQVNTLMLQNGMILLACMSNHLFQKFYDAIVIINTL